MKKEPKIKYLYAAGSHAGMKGKNNEDSYLVLFPETDGNQTDKNIFAIIADGIGGHLAGEVASEIAVETISAEITNSDWNNPQQILRKSFGKANDEILEHTKNNESFRGMGTTCVVAWIIGNRLHLNSIGNSRAYLLRKKQFFQLNTDHTWVQEAVDAGTLTPSQARKHPHANVIRRYLGSLKPFDSDLLIRGSANAPAKIYPMGFKIKYGDRLLLCSDGLNDMVLDDKIEKIMRFNQVEDAISLLIDEANNNGGKDNITVVLIEKPALWFSQLIPDINLHNPNVQAVFGIGIILAIVIGAFIIYLWQLFSTT